MRKLVEDQKSKDLMHDGLTERLRTSVDRRHVSGAAREPYPIATLKCFVQRLKSMKPQF